MSAFAFFADTYDTERLKILSVWSQMPDGQMGFRPEPRARTPREHMVHQCVSEDAWMRKMLGIDAGRPVLPPRKRAARSSSTMRRYPPRGSRAAIEARRVVPRADGVLRRHPIAGLGARPALHALGASSRPVDRLYADLGQPLYSTYGPTADTGGLSQNGAPVVYRYDTIEDLLAGEGRDGCARPAGPRHVAADGTSVNVLVTGGTGMLGREVVRAVTAAGHRAVTMSRKPAPDVAAAPRWATADIVTGQGLAAAVADMDAIIHAATMHSGNAAADEDGTRRLAEAARAARVRHLVFVSIVGMRPPSRFRTAHRELAAERALAASGQPYDPPGHAVPLVRELPLRQGGHGDAVRHAAPRRV